MRHVTTMSTNHALGIDAEDNCFVKKGEMA